MLWIVLIYTYIYFICWKIWTGTEYFQIENNICILVFKYGGFLALSPHNVFFIIFLIQELQSVFRGPLCYYGLISIPPWIISHIHYNVWGEITYALWNISGATNEVWEWISTFIPHWSLGMDKYYHPTLYWVWLFIHTAIKDNLC